jgi:hypothetical protein
MQKLTLYAQHADGRKLFYPQWDADGEIINTRKPTAAVSIQDGVTFPVGSIWIRKPRGSGLQAGWKFAEAIQGKKTRNQVCENKGIVSSTMRWNPILEG